MTYPYERICLKKGFLNREINEFFCNDCKVISFRIALHSFKLFGDIDCLEIHQFPKKILVLKWKHLQKTCITLKGISETQGPTDRFFLLCVKNCDIESK